MSDLSPLRGRMTAAVGRVSSAHLKTLEEMRQSFRREQVRVRRVPTPARASAL